MNEAKRRNIEEKMGAIFPLIVVPKSPTPRKDPIRPPEIPSPNTPLL
jgi:hypothetical protein